MRAGGIQVQHGGMMAAGVTILLATLLVSSAHAQKNKPTENATIAEEETSTGPPLTGDPQHDYKYDPNLPFELMNYDLSDYPFYKRVPKEGHNFTCDDRLDGFYASVPHKCQVYYNCLFNQRYDFLCANYTVFDQVNFICHYASEVDCDNSERYYDRNEELYVTTTTTTPAPRIIYVDRPRPRPIRPLHNRRQPVRPAFRRRPRPQAPAVATVAPEQQNEKPKQDMQYYDYYDNNDYYYDDYYGDGQATTSTTTTTVKPIGRRRLNRPNRPGSGVRGGLRGPGGGRRRAGAGGAGGTGPGGRRRRFRLRGGANGQDVQRRRVKTTTTTAAPVEYADYADDYYYYDDVVYDDKAPANENKAVAPANTPSNNAKPAATTIPREKPGQFRRPGFRRSQGKDDIITTESPTEVIDATNVEVPEVLPAEPEVRVEQQSSRRQNPILPQTNSNPVSSFRIRQANRERKTPVAEVSIDESTNARTAGSGFGGRRPRN